MGLLERRVGGVAECSELEFQASVSDSDPETNSDTSSSLDSRMSSNTSDSSLDSSEDIEFLVDFLAIGLAFTFGAFPLSFLLRVPAFFEISFESVPDETVR